MELEELLKILTQFPDSEKKKELISKAEGLTAKTEEYKQKYSGRTDEEAVKESRDLEREIDSFMQKGYDSLKEFGEGLKGKIRKEEEDDEGGVIICTKNKIFWWLKKFGCKTLYESSHDIFDPCLTEDALYFLEKGKVKKIPDCKTKIGGRYIDISGISGEYDCIQVHCNRLFGVKWLNSILKDETDIYKLSESDYGFKMPELTVPTKAISFMHSDGKDLYSVTTDKEIFKNANKVAYRSKDIYALCSHAGKVYDYGKYGLCETSDALEKKPVITNEVFNLCSHKTGLYATDVNKTWEIFTGKELSKKYIALCSTPKKLIGITSKEICDAQTGEKLCNLPSDITTETRAMAVSNNTLQKILQIE